MAWKRSITASSFGEFKHRLQDRMVRLGNETGMTPLVMPIGLFLVLDEANGGDRSADEAIRRFQLIDFESRDFLDFYFLGWKTPTDPNDKKIIFDLASFSECRRALEKAGVRKFGGYADLILVDARYDNQSVVLNFDEAIRIDLASAVSGKQVESVGALLESIIQAASRLKDDKELAERYTFRLSDRLALAVARESMLESLLTKFGSFFGASKMQSVCTRDLGPPVSLADL
jgi:hypothetical protein